MKELINKVLLAGDKLMPEIFLRQPRFTYTFYDLHRQFTENKKRIRKCKITGHSGYNYQNKLDKAYFQQVTFYIMFSCKRLVEWLY